MDKIKQIADELSEKQIIETINEMCIKSLDPDNFKNWENVRKGLELVRKNLK